VRGPARTARRRSLTGPGPPPPDRGLRLAVPIVLLAALGVGCSAGEDARSAADCVRLARAGFRPVATARDERFLGKVAEITASCRGGERALRHRETPWVDWSSYWGTGDVRSRGRAGTTQDRRGIDGALLDLEYQRVELIAFNLFDSPTYETYVRGREGLPGPSVRVWPEMRLPPNHPLYAEVGGRGEQLCRGALIRHRTITGVCNDLRNPAMGATGQLFGRIVPFEATFPSLGEDERARSRHGSRIGLLVPDPQVISRKLLTRQQTHPEKCRSGLGLGGDSVESECDYQKASSLNVLGAFWIQFMTHDWFSHLEEGKNAARMTDTGCLSHRVDGVETPLGPGEVAELGCRPGDRVDRAILAQDAPPATSEHDGQSRVARAHKTTRNTVSAWWDASQIYGHDETSRLRVKRDPADRARLLLVPTARDPRGVLPVLEPDDPMNPAWAGQEATAFPDNWSIGLSFFHNVFAREHNAFVDAFREQAARTPEADCGLRDPARPGRVIRYADATPDELFEAARLVIAAEIAKIHTIEWTTQLLYDEPLHLAMNANWRGLLGGSHPELGEALGRIVTTFGSSSDVKKAHRWYSVFASGPGIVGLGSYVYEDDSVFAAFTPGKRDVWDLANPDHVNGGTNHFGSPFSFPEEFVTVYRLHPLVPDLLEYRELGQGPDVVRKKVPVVETFRGRATAHARSGGLASWALSLGRQRAGALVLGNEPRFLQDLPLPRLRTETNRIDVAALDILRDRERGVPRYNELRRQLGLRQLTSFDDFVDPRLPPGAPERAVQEERARRLREVYGRHRCDASLVITDAQRNEDGSAIDDCLGHPHGSLVDNVEDVDAVVGWLAEPVRPHGFAISETQLQVFILTASRRLFSDRFFTSSFRPEFYTTLGLRWVEEGGPDGKVMEPGTPNGHPQEVSPLKRVLLRTVPELAAELRPVVNVFDPWARDRGEYYALDWKPRPGAEGDESFRP